MKNRLTKVIALVLACVTIVCLASFAASAASISISYLNGNAMGYSEHDQYSSVSRTWGFSEGDCVFNTSGNFYYTAIVNKGNLGYAHLYSYAQAVNGSKTVYYNGTAQSNINKTSQNVTFDFGAKTNIIMEESAYTGVDQWSAKYDYVWNYNASQSRMTLVSGTYTSY